MDNLSPDQIKAMITMLQGMLPSENPPTVNTEESVQSQENTIKTAPSRKINQGQFVNKFDAMMESKLHKDDCVIDQKLKQFDPTPRTRNFKPLTVKCRVCGKTESINPSLLVDTPDRYKCNSCSRSAG